MLGSSLLVVRWSGSVTRDRGTARSEQAGAHNWVAVTA